MYRLLLTDLDDTLLNSKGRRKKGRISEVNKAAIIKAKDNGCDVVLCSGRSNMSIDRFNQYLGIESYSIGFNGGLIYKGSEILVCHYLDKELVKKIIDFCHNYKINILLYQHNKLWIEKRNFFTKQYSKRQGIKPIVVNDLSHNLSDEINKIFLLGKNKTLRKIVAALPQEISTKCSSFFSHKYLFEFNPLDVTKGTALKELAARLDIPIEEVIAVGDEENDIDMIQAAGFGIAVKNAIPALQNEALYITKNDCNNNAIAEIISKFILEEEN